MLDVIRLLKDHRIPFKEAGTHRHASTGWVQVHCPSCDKGGDGYHCGINLNFGNCNCWRCGKLDRLDVFASLIGSKKAAIKALRSYNTSSAIPGRKEVQLSSVCTLPKEAGPLQKAHRRYLRGRGFDPDELEELWNLKGTGRFGRLSFRVIAPVYFDGKLVSYQGRDYTDRAQAPYLPCLKEEEARPHKDCLYGMDMVPGRSVVVVEGIVDVWRIGPGAVATFGSGYSLEQQRLLAERYDWIYLLYDPEPEAQQKADSLAVGLEMLGKEAEVWELEEGIDPGELDKGRIKQLKNRANL